MRLLCFVYLLSTLLHAQTKAAGRNLPYLHSVLQLQLELKRKLGHSVRAAT